MGIEIGIQPGAVLEDQAAERLKQHQAKGKPLLTDAKRKEIKKVAQDFEGLFLGMMFKSMRQTVPEDKLTGGGKAEETYRYMLDQEYVNAAAKRGSTGLAKTIEKELLRRYQQAPAAKNKTAESVENRVESGS